MTDAPFDELTGAWEPGVPATADEIARWQLDRAWEVAERLATGNPWYRSRIELPDERTPTAFRSLPTTTKDDVVADAERHPPYGSRTTCPAGRVSHVVETGGTSGRGREVYALDADDELAVLRTEAVGFWWAGVRPGTRVHLTLPVGVSAAGLWYLHGLRLLGANVMSAGAYPTDRKVELLGRYGADVVVGTPSYVQRLGLACRNAGLDATRLGVSTVLVAGEPYGPAWAAAIEELWGATLYEQYGCTERAIAWTCPGGVLADGGLGVLHFPAEGAHIEVIDPSTGEPVDDGGWGELVVTPLRAAASPLLRFATRDRVRWHAPGTCRCGRPLAGIAAGSVQRYDDMLKVRGLNLWPQAVDAAVLDLEGVVDYRAVVTCDAEGREQVRLTVEPVTHASRHLGRDVAHLLRRDFSLGADVEVVAPGAITGSVPEGFVKVARWRDERRDSSIRALENA